MLSATNEIGGEPDLQIAPHGTLGSGDDTGLGEVGYDGGDVEEQDDDEEGGENELVVLDPAHVSVTLHAINDCRLMMLFNTRSL